MTEMERNIQYLMDLEAIKRLRALYAYHVDHFEMQAWAELFTEDGVFDIDTLGRFEGREQILGFQLLPFAIHYMTNPIIDIAADGRTAQGKWLLLEPCSISLEAGQPQRPLWGAARYEDEYVKVDGAWKFKLVKLRSIMWSPFESGWEKARNVWA
ncbi:MAG: nuclear transport factor 2 family protein [Sneathiellaceae bacterium]